jgi:hypothetical protein
MSEQWIKLYRGLAVSASASESIQQEIVRKGIIGEEGTQWKFDLPNLRKDIEALILRADLSLDHTRRNRSSFRVICACGDSESAAYYAWKHNRSAEHDAPLIIEFEARLDDIFVDGRDFLYMAFQFWDRHTASALSEQMLCLKMLFGDPVLRYFRRATDAKDQQQRVALCDLAVQDEQVVLAHRLNHRAIRGRYNTTFASAFFARTPITSREISSVVVPPQPATRPWLTLDSFIAGNIPSA